MDKKLYKIEEGKVLCGVCAGVAEYLKLDVNIVRVLWVVLAICGSLGFWAYLVCALILPWKPAQIVEAEPVVEVKHEEDEG